MEGLLWHDICSLLPCALGGGSEWRFQLCLHLWPQVSEQQAVFLCSHSATYMKKWSQSVCPPHFSSYILIKPFLFLFLLVPLNVIGLALIVTEMYVGGGVGSRVGTSSKWFVLAFLTPDLIYHLNNILIYSDVQSQEFTFILSVFILMEWSRQAGRLSTSIICSLTGQRGWAHE